MRPILLALVAALAAGAAWAQQPPAKRTILQRADVAASPAQETLFGTVEIAPGSGNVRHIHNGTEIGMVLEGRIRLEVDGQPTRTLGPGETFMVARGAPHRSVLDSPTGAKLLSTWTVDKGGDLLIPVK
ncbi:MAG: hypothetical protein JWO72_2185 [Caulobacteraceae bacterium]|nr:hypothetical protein [Caulobacteraceae bacterium]